MSRQEHEELETEFNKVEEQEIKHIIGPVSHEWEQRGTSLECHTCPAPHGTLNAIPHDKMLIKNSKGEYDIVPIQPIQ